MRKAYLSLLPLVLPLAYLPFLPNPYEFTKFLLFTFSVQLVLILSIREIYRQIPLLVKDKLILLAGFLLFLLLIADLTGLDVRISLLGSPVRLQGFLLWLSLVEYMILLRLLPPPKPQSLLSHPLLTVIPVIILCGITLWEKVASSYLHLFIPTYHGRIVATMGNPNFLGAVLVIELFLLLSLFPWPRKLTANILFIGLQASIIAGVLFTQSQSALIGLAVGYSMYAVLRIKNNLVKASIVVALGGVLILIGLSVTRNFSIWDNQLRIWPVAFEKIIERPILGYGQENFQLIFPQEYHYTVDSTHNLFLEVAVGGGIGALLAFLILIATAVRQLDRRALPALIVAIVMAQFNPLSIAHLVWIWYLLSLQRMKER